MMTSICGFTSFMRFTNERGYKIFRFFPLLFLKYTNEEWKSADVIWYVWVPKESKRAHFVILDGMVPPLTIHVIIIIIIIGAIARNHRENEHAYTWKWQKHKNTYCFVCETHPFSRLFFIKDSWEQPKTVHDILI